MKLVLLLLLTGSLLAYGQENKDSGCMAQLDSLTHMHVYTFVDKMPTVDGGMTAIFKEVSSRLKFPDNKRYGIESKILVAYVITEDGKVVGQRTLKNIEGTDLAEQLLGIIGEFEWQPGICNGKAVPTIMLLPMILHFN